MHLRLIIIPWVYHKCIVRALFIPECEIWVACEPMIDGYPEFTVGEQPQIIIGYTTDIADVRISASNTVIIRLSSRAKPRN
ncbi:hypothetical protein NPIL_263221 [Nephila pilipes]|uniref:Uncharacterized protein n=1 Tax=Nephila pilipes TaxID=299642 RepID=A0A8X6R5L8_NEPPI|nr:hypothetical protein NPIL_263221 [Nephila pilipes]